MKTAYVLQLAGNLQEGGARLVMFGDGSRLVSVGDFPLCFGLQFALKGLLPSNRDCSGIC